MAKLSEEEMIEILQNFKNNKLEQDRLEIRSKGGFKIGDIYKLTELNPAIERFIRPIPKGKRKRKKLGKNI